MDSVIRSGDDSFSLGLIGYPLEHSLSPELHAAALSGANLKGDYRLYPIPPSPEGEKQIQRLLERVRNGEVHGLNVTIPHKQTVIAYLDELRPRAEAIGAVNTVYLRDGRVVGDNTDAPGFLADLTHVTKKPLPGKTARPSDDKHALILGAGGSARAVAYALVDAGWRITIASRRVEQAVELAASSWPVIGSGIDSPTHMLQAIPLDEYSISDVRPDINLIVNCTPVGMWPKIDGSPWPQRVPFPPGATLYDLVYNPPETALVKEAQAAGLVASTGLGMLVEQAALAFEIWTDRTASRELMYKAVPGFLTSE